LGAKSKEITNNIKSPDAFYFGFYGVSLPVILKVLEGEVGKNNNDLLLKVINQIPQITQEGKVFTGFNETKAEYSDSTKEEVDSNTIRPQLLDLLTEILKDPKKIKGYLMRQLKEYEKPKQEDSNATKPAEGLTELDPEQVILEYLKYPKEYEQLVVAVNKGMPALIAFNRKKYTSAPFALSTIMKEVKEFEEYTSTNSIEPSSKSYETFKEDQKQKLEAAENEKKQIKKQIKEIEAQVKKLTPAHINAEIAKAVREEKITDAILNGLNEITGKNLTTDKLQNLTSVKGYDDDLAKKILTFLIKQGVIDLDSLKPSSTIETLNNQKRTK
jgi:hypothetical protein